MLSNSVPVLLVFAIFSLKDAGIDWGAQAGLQWGVSPLVADITIGQVFAWVVGTALVCAVPIMVWQMSGSLPCPDFGVAGHSVCHHIHKTLF